VCIDAWDVGMIETQFGKKHRVAVRHFCGQFHAIDGERHPAFLDSYFNATLGEKSTLRAFVESWRGRAFTPEELEGFDLEKLVGAPAYIQVVQVKKGENVYANVKSIMRLPKGMAAPAIPTDYVRVKDRPTDDNGEAPRTAEPEPDDDLPF